LQISELRRDKLSDNALNFPRPTIWNSTPNRRSDDWSGFPPISLCEDFCRPQLFPAKFLSDPKSLSDANP
jgi:hypothetical protein